MEIFQVRKSLDSIWSMKLKMANRRTLINTRMPRVICGRYCEYFLETLRRGKFKRFQSEMFTPFQRRAHLKIERSLSVKNDPYVLKRANETHLSSHYRTHIGGTPLSALVRSIYQRFQKLK